MEIKYELTDETIQINVKTLHRIKALKDFGDVKKGDIGGYVENEWNLSQNGECWIYGKAKAYDNARVNLDAKIYDNVRISGNAMITDKASAHDNVWIRECAVVCDSAKLYDSAIVYGSALVCSNAIVTGRTVITGNAWITQNAGIHFTEDYATLQGFGSAYRSTTFFRTIDGGIGVQCGCFYGTLAEFREKVKETHGDSKKAKEYLMIADLMEYRFSSEKE